MSAKLGALIGAGGLIALLGGAVFLPVSADEVKTVEDAMVDSTDQELTEKPSAVVIHGAPELTPAKAKAIRDALANRKRTHLSLLAIARNRGQSLAQVKLVLRKMQAERAKRLEAAEAKP